MKKFGFMLVAGFIALNVSCEVLDDDIEKHTGQADSTGVGLDEVARILSCVPLKNAQMMEVHDAVTSSSVNGYDEEYTMKNLFSVPGSGVGDRLTKSADKYDEPLRDLIARQIRSMTATRSAAFDPEAFISALSESDVQIYWPFSEDWDGETMPVITFDPEDDAYNNIGYRLVMENDGSRRVEEVVVDEEMAMNVPVWVVNRNTDAGYTSLEMLRREDPQWGEGGGTIIVKPDPDRSETRSGAPLRSLVLKDFTMNRNYDSWFAGASEFFVKIGYVDDFTASTEAELRLYNPMVTDFMVVVKRRHAGVPQTMNAILMSDWSEQMTSCAFMITEDDGGTQTEWTCKAKVFVSSKSYGIEISLPIKTRDEIVWRGELANSWFEKYNNEKWAFGDVELTFEIL